MKHDRQTNGHWSSRGFTLVDVMVGMAIALFGVIIIFQVFSVSEGIKRTTTSGGDAQQNGAGGLFMLQRALRSAGYGIFASNNDPPLPSDPPGTAPVTLTAGATAAVSDSLTITNRRNWEFGSFPPDPTVYASAVPPALTVETFSVNNQAQLVSSVDGVIAEGIVLFKAELGVDANGDGVIDSGEWTQAAPADPWRVYAVRVALVARSAQPEKPSVAGSACDTTVVAPSWSGVSVALDLSANVGLAAGDDWRCYRYKTFESIVPLRNVMWRQT